MEEIGLESPTKMGCVFFLLFLVWDMSGNTFHQKGYRLNGVNGVCVGCPSNNFQRLRWWIWVNFTSKDYLNCYCFYDKDNEVSHVQKYGM